MRDFFDKNTILGMLLIMLLVTVYIFYTKNKYEKAAADAVNQSKISAQTSSDTTKQFVQEKTNPVLGLDKKKDTILKGDIVFIENDLVKIAINTMGAQIVSGELKKHTSHQDKAVQILNQAQTECVLQPGSFKNTNYVFDLASRSAESITLKTNDGVTVSYTLKPNKYLLEQNWSGDVFKNATPKLNLKAEMTQAENNLERERQYSSIYYLPQNEDLMLSLDKTKNETRDENRGIHWISFGQQFFNFSIIPDEGFQNATFSSQYLEKDTNYVKQYKFTSQLKTNQDLKINYFIGPSDYKQLKVLNKELDQIVPLSQDFVLFRWMKIFNIYLIIPIFQFLSKFISNYGIIILLLTIFIKVITAPLQYKTYRSGVAMRILKPELEKLKLKYGDDQQKYATKQMKIFNEVGVNPLGGCLPMLMQMPILFAMFSFFPSAIELRHQAFLWAPDLSTYDNVLNLPFKIWGYGSHISLFALLSAVTQIATTVYAQRLQPSSPQADQMKMMTYMMPVIFLFMFNSFPAALTFYYFLQNVLGVLQQWIFTTFIIKEDKVRAEMELAKKTPKKQGAFQQKMQEMMAQAEEQKKMQQKNNRK